MQVCTAGVHVPLMTQLELDSPGCTLADRTTYFLSPTHPGDTQEEVNYHSSVNCSATVDLLLCNCTLKSKTVQYCIPTSLMCKVQCNIQCRLYTFCICRVACICMFMNWSLCIYVLRTLYIHVWREAYSNTCD